MRGLQRHEERTVVEPVGLVDAPGREVVAVALALPMSGCARNRDKGDDAGYVARDVNTLYLAGRERFERGVVAGLR